MRIEINRDMVVPLYRNEENRATAIPPRDETGSQISARLLEVIAHAELEVLPELYAFGPLTEGVTPRKDALACVRDGGAWGQLVPVDDGAMPTAFRIFSFHFDPAFDATGFVGWLHSHLARSTDTGHMAMHHEVTRRPA